ncbi:MAG TPA: hypothetical protein PKD32_05210 [Saprospiraceae bacterium]|nr:hypothetical protein [Saprospiraceae bacterium]
MKVFCLLFLACLMSCKPKNTSSTLGVKKSEFCMSCTDKMKINFTNWCTEVKYTNTMFPGDSLTKGQALQSQDKSVKLSLGTDGALVIVCCENLKIKKDISVQGHIWHLSSNDRPNQSKFIFSKSGNLQVMDSSGKVTFQLPDCLACDTCMLVLQNDGNLVMKNNEKITWQTGATCSNPKDGTSGYGVPLDWKKVN